MIRRPPRSTLSSSSAASDVYKRQLQRARSSAVQMPITGRLILHTIGSTRAGRHSTPGEAPITTWHEERRAMSEPDMELATVNARVRDGVATIELNRPEALNAWNAQLGADLLAALRRAGQDDAARRS